MKTGKLYLANQQIAINKKQEKTEVRYCFECSLDIPHYKKDGKRANLYTCTVCGNVFTIEKEKDK